VDTQVIIVGGGPVGLSLALGLARHGVRSVVLERNTAPVRESRAAVIWPRTQEIFRDYGVLEPLRSAGRFVRRIRGVNARTGLTLLDVNWAAIDDVFDDPGALLLPQSETERILRSLVARNERCDLRTGATVRSLAQDDAGVDVTFETESGMQRLRAPYAAGCDGAHGIVRSALGLTLAGITYDTRVVLSDEVLNGPVDDSVSFRARMDLPGLRGAIRFSDRMWRVLASIPKNLPDEDALSPIAHQQRLHEIFGDVETTTVWSSIFKIHRRHAQRFLVARVALAGDAAHLNSPAGGQGMNAGIQDTANLAWKISAALRNDACASALLESYDRERREMVTDTVERFTDRLTRIGIGLPTRVRQFAVRSFSRATRARGMQRKICRGVGMLSGRYANSPIIDSRHPLAGRRIDDLRLPDGTRINQRRAGDAAIVVTGDFALDLPHVHVPVPPARWHVKPPVALIVRPDGCVAAVVEKPTRERIESAWQKAFCGALPLPLFP
jgi:2-polyprenyl-6-methoxyphenol hydroxylase-like FAD-dependent oxidoreductase